MDLHTLKIENKYGSNFSTHASEKGAFDALDNYVKEWWEHEMTIDMPKDKDEALQLYFDVDHGVGWKESWDVEETTLQE